MIGIVCVIYIDNETTYKQALHSLDSITSSYPLKLYARVVKLSNEYLSVLNYFGEVIKEKKNILARCWNNGIKDALKDKCEYVIFPNLDIECYPDTIDNLINFARNDDSVMWSGRCINTGAKYPSGNFIVNSYTVYDNFAFPVVNNRLFKEVGEFDEKFIPCYGEDVDMQYRIELAGRKHTCVESAGFKHFGQTTVNNSPDWKIPLQDKAHEYFIRKWGGFPRQHKFKTPFNK